MRRCFLHGGSGHGKVVSVRITVLGCSGSVVGPDSPASGYLLRAPDTPPLVLDFGGGVLGALQRYADPGSVQVLLSHLHADHCLDMPGLFVWRRYHPSRPQGKSLLYGPSDTWSRLGAASSPYGGEIDDCSDIFDVHHWVDGEPVTIGTLTVTPAAPRLSTAATRASVISSSSWLATPTFSCARPPGHTRRIVRPLCTCRARRPAGSRHGRAYVSCC
jgi:ribonuclease BN (tRNA processing enzyme)